MLRYHSANPDTAVSYEYTQRNPDITQAFVLNGYGDFLCDRNYFTERDGFPEYLIFYTLAGKGSLQYNGSQIELTPGRIALINCKNYQYYKTADDGFWHFLWIHFTSPVAEELEKYINQGGIFAPTIPSSVYIHYYDSIAKLASHVSSSSETTISLFIHTILEKMVSMKASEIHERRQDQKANIEKAMVYIQDHFSRAITIDALSEIAHISKFYFIKLFKEITGTTPYRFLLLTRIDEAKRLLRQTDLPVSVIGEQIGFCDSKIFIHQFKKATGITPLQFKKAII